MNYPVVLHKDRDSDYGVTVPDLPGCFSAGKTVDEALAMAKEAIELHLEGLIHEGQPIPRPSGIEQHQQNCGLSGRRVGPGDHRSRRLAGACQTHQHHDPRAHPRTRLTGSPKNEGKRVPVFWSRPQRSTWAGAAGSRGPAVQNDRPGGIVQKAGRVACRNASFHFFRGLRGACKCAAAKTARRLAWLDVN